MKKIIKEYSDKVALIYRVEKNLIDYYVDKEFKNTLIFEYMTEKEFIESDKVYERVLGIKCNAEVINLHIIERPILTDEELFQKLFGNVTNSADNVTLSKER